MAKLIDTTTQKHHIQEMHIKRWLKGLFILLLTLILLPQAFTPHTPTASAIRHTPRAASTMIAASLFCRPSRLSHSSCSV